MATYNGSRFIRQSINSILGQTIQDFELIITDDCSDDGTNIILSRINDPRVKILSNSANLGVVKSRNRCLAAARGQYVAMLDHDDLSRPTRLAKQVAYLEEHPGIVLVGTAAHTLDNGALTPTRHPPRSSPMMIRWLLYVANPLICSSIMFRADGVRRLDIFLREEYKYADDYDLYHRLMSSGDIARLDEPLTIYRLHGSNAFRLHEDTMTANAIRVLTPAYLRWFGSGAEEAVSLIVRHLSTGRPVPSTKTLAALQKAFEQLNVAFAASHPMEDADKAAIAAYADELWRRMLRTTINSGVVARGSKALTLPSGRRFSRSDLPYSFLGRIPFHGLARQRLRRLLKRPGISIAPSRPGQASDTLYEQIEMDGSRPPTMFVVVDTEAEFNWDQPFARDLTGVTAMDDIERGQAVFDHYGLRPVYVVDFPIASQDRSVRRMRAMLDRGACYIGAHLHPWTTPPFEETLSDHNSFPGNLTPDQEEQKLVCLLATIHERLGVMPLFYKAGRYGCGLATKEILIRHGIKVDLSVLPGADLRGKGGPNFGAFESVPYWAAGERLLTVPMTRRNIGLLPSLGTWVETVQRLPGLRWLKIQPVLSRLRITDTITLTPEGVTAAEQIRLIKSMLRRGNWLFVMHYHSPSLSPGHTPYVRSAKDADRFVQCIWEVSRFFFEEVGGMPGYPPDLLDIAESRVAALSDMAFPANSPAALLPNAPGGGGEVNPVQRCQVLPP